MSHLTLGSASHDLKTEIEFSVDQARPHQKWAVVVTDHGSTILSKTKTTNAHGEFEVRKKVAGANSHVVVVTATNAATGETCSASGAV